LKPKSFKDVNKKLKPKFSFFITRFLGDFISFGFFVGTSAKLKNDVFEVQKAWK